MLSVPEAYCQNLAPKAHLMSDPACRSCLIMLYHDKEPKSEMATV